MQSPDDRTHHVRSLARWRTWRLLAGAGAVAWAAVIFRFSMLPGTDVPSRFGVLAHFLEFAILAVLIHLSADDRSDTFSAMVFAVAMASAYAVSDELHQAFVPGRVPDPLDWVTDTAGAMTGALIAVSALRLLRRKPPTQ